MNVICFDIEATDNGEMLELSVFSYPAMEEIFHSYFHPDKAREWPTTERIHHITPQMVASSPRFTEKKTGVQKLIDESDLIIGFAVDNDLRYLRRAGINISQKKPVIDVRDMFMMVYGRHFEIAYGAVPRLAKCAELIGLSFTEEEDAHSATNDTRATLQLFDRLLKEHNGGTLTPTLPKEIGVCMDEMHEEMLRHNAKGALRLIPCHGGGYKLKNNRLEDAQPLEVEDGEYAIRVNSRFLGEHDMRQTFMRRADKFRAGVYNLRKSDIERFMAYKNEFNAVQEMVCRNRYGYKRSKNHLEFDM